VNATITAKEQTHTLLTSVVSDRISIPERRGRVVTTLPMKYEVVVAELDQRGLFFSGSSSGE
jgi:hypothetical protein